jgi:integrase
VKFTDKYIAGLKSKEKDYRVREGHGFAIRVLPSGVKRFEYIYSVDGKRRILHLGNYPAVTLAEAREKYLEAAQKTAKGVDPQNELQVLDDAPTVAGLANLYLKHIEGHLVARSVAHQTRSITRDVLPVIGNVRVADIRRRDAIHLIESIAKRAPGQARNVLLHARTMFTYAVHRELIEYNPFSGVGAAVPKAAPRSRERVLEQAEIQKVLECLWQGAETSFVRRAILLVLVTGQRPGEVVGMHSREISLGEGKPHCAECRRCGWWTIPKERSKNGRENRVYLTPLALELIVPLKGYFFPAGRGASGPLLTNTLAHHISSVLYPKYFGFERWTPHDLRRTAATGLAALGCTDEIIDAIQNHKKKGVVATYNRYRYDSEKEEWLSKWSDFLVGYLAGKPVR